MAKTNQPAGSALATDQEKRAGVKQVGGWIAAVNDYSRPFRARVIASGATVLIAALPAYYTMFPEVSSAPGVWSEDRYWILGSWSLILFLLLINVEHMRQKSAADQTSRLEGAASVAHGAAIASRLEVSAIRRHQFSDETRLQLSAAIQDIARLDEESILPTDRTTLVVPFETSNGIVQESPVPVIYPHLYTGSNQLSTELIVNIFDIKGANLGRTWATNIPETLAEMLPTGLRHIRHSAVACIPGKKAEPIGVIILCSHDKSVWTKRGEVLPIMDTVARRSAPIVIEWHHRMGNEEARTTADSGVL